MPASDHKRRLTAFVVAMAVLIATPLAVVAADAFTDVSESSVHHDNIAWLKDAGVTSGCNPPENTEYCPGDNVTRAQMATFMRNLAENQVVDAATAIDSEQLDGAAPDAYTTLIWAETCGIQVVGPPVDLETDCLPASGGNVTAGTSAEVFSLDIEAPSAGALQMASTSLSGGSLVMSFTVDQTCSSNLATLIERAVAGHIWGNSPGVSSTAYLPIVVTSGSHTVRLCGFNDTPGPVQLATAALTTTWTAGGSVSVTGSDSSPVEMPELLGT